LISAPPLPGPVGLTVTVLQSGSAGNATLIQAGETALLIDCGLPLRVLGPRLAAQGIEPAQLAAVLVTHEHGDHLGGCAPLARRFGTALYMTEGTARGSKRLLKKKGIRECIRILPARGWLAFRQGESCDGAPDEVDLSVDWVPVSHDAQETVAYAVQRRGFRFGVITDLGRSTPPVERMLGTLDAVSLEANHDPGMLKRNYPPFLARRVSGDEGHLSNQQAAELFARAATPRLRQVLLAHISERTNSPEIAFAELEKVMEGRKLGLTEYRKAIPALEF